MDEDFEDLQSIREKLFSSDDVNNCKHTNVYCQGGLTICSDCGKETCEHKETEEIDGLNICIYCGEELTEISYEKDWRFYGKCDNKNKQDPSRCHKRKDNAKSIFTYVEGKNFLHSIIANANEKYAKIKDDTHRGKNNKAVITACIFAAYLDEKEPKTAAEIGKAFNLNKKNISKGLGTFYEYFPQYLQIYIKPSDLLRRILIRVNIDMSHYYRIKKLCEYIENGSSQINRSTPQSVACAVIYLYLSMMPSLKEDLGLTKSKFTNLVGMSDITISKICKEALQIIKQEIKI